MSGYLVLAWRDDAAASAARYTAQVASGVRWRLAVDRRGLAVFVGREHPLPCVQLPGLVGVVVGPIFDRAAADEGRGRPAEIARLPALAPADMARRLAADVWGRYVAVLPDPDGGLNLFRDPLGGLECLTWRREGMVFASDAYDPAAPRAARAISVNWDQVAALLRQKNLSSVSVPLDGVDGISPGVLRRANGREEVIWRPADFASRSVQRSIATPKDLARTVDGCVAAWAAGRRSLLCEVSGGLDSAIVLAALTRARAPVVGAINHHWAEPESDERRFARDVAAMAGVDLEEQANGLLILDADKLARTARSARPSFNAQDPDYDASMAARLAAIGADGLFTGQGGDAVFHQMPSPELLGDLLRGCPCDGPRLAAAAQLARRTRRSVWSLFGQALRDGRRPVGLREPISFLSADCAHAEPGDRHPWLRDLTEVSPAKQVQIRALTNNQGMFGDSLRGRHGLLIQPLMSQTLVELCLAIPAPRLAIGEFDRPFARAAFADRLPASVMGRRGKGDLSVFFARSMAANLPFLRDYLLGGSLVENGLIDQPRLEGILDPDILIGFDHFGELTIALILEAWVRRWQAEITRQGRGSRRAGGWPSEDERY